MSLSKKKSAPLYRKLILQATKESWRNRWLWPFALFAAMLVTGGIYDVILVSLQDLKMKQTLIFPGQVPNVVTSAWARLMDGSNILQLVSSWENLLFALLFIAVILGLSLIGQGALVHGIGGRIKGRKPHFRESITIGANNLWPILLLNIFTLGLTWFAKFLVFLPYGNTVFNPSLRSLLFYLVTTLIFIATLIVLTSVHLFTLNALMLQRASLHDALLQAFTLVKKGWLAILELALILFGLAIGIFATSIFIFFVMIIPLILAALATIAIGQTFALTLIYYLGAILFFTLFILAGMFTVTLQYTAWHLLFLKLGEGGLIAKLHRWSAWFTSSNKSKHRS